MRRPPLCSCGCDETIWPAVAVPADAMEIEVNSSRERPRWMEEPMELPHLVRERPHGSLAAGVVVIAAGVYELTPVKRHFRRRCRESIRSGLKFGLCCAGSSIGLVGMLVALGVMSVAWMTVIAVIALAQKLLPPKAAIDVPLALAIVGLGVLILSPAGFPRCAQQGSNR